MTDTISVLEKIRQLFRLNEVPFKEISHSPTFTSEESARARGEELRTGGKALLMKVDLSYGLFVLPADRKIDSAAIKRELAIKSLRFASKEELLELTGLVPGSVPPFGEPILSFPLYVDSWITNNEKIAFNAGSLSVSHIVFVQDYLRIARPRVFTFSKINSCDQPSPRDG